MKEKQNKENSWWHSTRLDWIQSGLVWIMALLFLLFGSSKFYPFMPTPPITPEAGRFLGALISTGYLWQFVGLVEIIGGLLLVFRRTRLVGALLLLPVIAHIVPYLWILARTVPGIPMGLFLIGMELWVLLDHRRKLQGLIVYQQGDIQ